MYAFTNCEVSISPNACVIIENKPHFMTVTEILKISTANTMELLRRELEIKKAELEEKWHFASLEKIFIENIVLLPSRKNPQNNFNNKKSLNIIILVGLCINGVRNVNVKSKTY